MKRAIVLVLVAACGNKVSGVKPDGSVPAIDAAPPIDSGPRIDAGPRVDLKATDLIDGLNMPVWVGSPPGDSRLFIVEKVGDVRVFANGALQPDLYVDLTGQVSSDNEQGLLGLAFHPDFATNGRLFVNYTDLNGDTHITEFDAADPVNSTTTTKVGDLIFQPQPAANHNGGNLVFSPKDQYLYFGLGDGGGGGDTYGNSRILTTLLSKMSRIDVDHGNPYEAPTDNPFYNTSGAKQEIWAWGLRNPWRWSFDRQTGDLWIGDVGQDTTEEIDFQPASSKGGEDYGWNIMEGDHCYNASTCDMSGMTLPVFTYSHADGCAVVGGYVYRGAALTGHQGDYFFSDNCSSWVKSFPATGSHVNDPDVTEWTNIQVANISSFGEDKDGELYVCALYDGKVYRIDPAP